MDTVDVLGYVAKVGGMVRFVLKVLLSWLS